MKHIQFCLVLSPFSVFYVQKSDFSCNQLAISTQLCSPDSQAACYILFKNSELFYWIYSGFSGSLCGSMSNFAGLFLLEFLSNRLQILAQ